MLPALIDTDSFRPCPERGAQFRRDWALGNDTLIVYLGGTQRFEGVADLLSAARILLVRRKRFRLIVAGEMVQGPFHDDLPGLVKENGLEGCILLPGRLNLQGVLGALAAADILVLPKRHDQANIAGFPQKLTEYLAAGKPVVTTNVGDVPLYLQDGETALLCEPDSPSALADAIQRVLDCPDLARHLADGARKLAVALFDRNVQAKALSDKLKSIHRRGSASAHPSS
jgi:glycosyltransferase involved in cell wall biosynthesis